MNEIIQIGNVYRPNGGYFQKGSNKYKGMIFKEKVTCISYFRQSVNSKKILDFVQSIQDYGSDILRENKPIK